MRDAVWQNTRVILFLAFGALLLLTAVLAYGTFRGSDRIYRDVTSVHDAYRQRASVLNEIQSEIYLSALLSKLAFGEIREIR